MLAFIIIAFIISTIILLSYSRPLTESKGCNLEHELKSPARETELPLSSAGKACLEVTNHPDAEEGSVGFILGLHSP